MLKYFLKYLIILLLHFSQARAYIALEGNFGAGKTTLLEHLTKQCPEFIPVYEPISKWQDVAGAGNIYKLYFSDMPRWALSMELYVLFTRIFAHKKALSKHKDKLCIIDHSIYIDYYCYAKPVYKQGLLLPIEWQIYRTMFVNTTKHLVSKPIGFIYLKTTPEVSHQRALKRGRPEDAHVPFSYWQMLHKHHEQLFNRQVTHKLMPKVPVLILDGDKDIIKEPAVLQEHIEKIKSFIAQLNK